MTKTIVLGNGCFWCTEAIYQQVRGVVSVEPGYSGGSVSNPTYEQVSSGRTGHAECSKIEYNSDEVSFEDLIEVFFGTHDPTTKDRQGNDVGTQYRSIIFFNTPEEKEIVEKIIKELNDNNAYGAPIVTELKPFESFFPAEDYHKNFYQNNPNQAYCQYVVSPKLRKFKEKFTKLAK
jgi:peptide-methionine (S)-S-oxide reductase